jgi:hypothetical protein
MLLSGPAAGAGGQQLEKLGMQDQNLVHVARRDYVINCNWKVFCDNYLVSCHIAQGALKLLITSACLPKAACRCLLLFAVHGTADLSMLHAVKVSLIRDQAAVLCRAHSCTSGISYDARQLLITGHEVASPECHPVLSKTMPQLIICCLLCLVFVSTGRRLSCAIRS